MPDDKIVSHAKVGIIGGGIMGVSLLYHLAKEGWKDLGLLETVLEEDGMGFQIRGFREQDEVEISDEEQERANHIAKSQDRGEM